MIALTSGLGLRTSIAATILACGTGASTAQTTALTLPGVVEYAVKFVCGRAPASTAAAPVPVAPGHYFTAINVHNPNTSQQDFRKKFSQALPNGKTGTSTSFSRAALGTNEAFDIECNEITKALQLAAGSFVTGFVVIQGSRELDIVAVYTSAATPSGPVSTFHTERVPKRP